MAKIRVLRVITWLPVGGIERKIIEALPRLDRERFEVSLVCLRERGPLARELEAAGIRVDCIPFLRRWDWGALRRLAGLMRERQIDVVHSHMYRSNVPATVAARLAGIRRNWAQIHNVDTWETRRQLLVDRFLCRWRSGVVAVSEEVRREAMEKLRLPEARVRLIYNGVDLARFGGAEGRAELRRERGVGERDVVFLMVARLVEQKRPQDFVDLAHQLLRKERIDPARPRVHFWIAGEGPMADALQSTVAEFPLQGRVAFLGRRDDVPRVLAAADVFVMTSTKEGFSNALLEAMASGLPALATRVGGNAEAVRDGIEGLLVPPLDAAALFASAEGLLLDAAQRASLARAARERSKAFGLEEMLKNLEKLYEE